MSNTLVDVKEAETKFKEILSKVISGAEVILTEGARPVARIAPVSRRVAGLHAKAIWTSPDFDEPLSDDFWTDDPI